MIKVLIVDDHEMVRLGIATYLGVQPDLTVVGQATDGRKGSTWRCSCGPMSS